MEMCDAHAPQMVLDSIPCGICIFSLRDGKIHPEYRNPAFYRILGCNEEHIAQMRTEMTFQGVHEEDKPVLRQKMEDLRSQGTVFQHTFRFWNDREQDYRWIQVEASTEMCQDEKRFYAVYSEASEQIRLERELTDANEKMQDIINAIPGGVAIYKVSDIFETVYFSDGVPELSGYTTEEYRQMIQTDAAEMTYWEDTPMVVAKAREVIRTHEIAEFEFRKQHRDGHIVWVRVQIKWIGEEDGCALLHCVFHNISDLKEAQLQMEHLVNSIPGGIASYKIEGNRWTATYYSDGILALTGRSRGDLEDIVRRDEKDVYELDKERVTSAIRQALLTGNVLDISYRVRHQNGNLIWIHLNGRRMGPFSDTMYFYAVFTGISEQTRLFQSIANETADGIYVIDKENYDLLYVNESKNLFVNSGENCVGQKCYAALHHQNTPCDFCTLRSHKPDGEEHEMAVSGTDRFYTTRFKETDWNGIPAYIKYIRDISDEVRTRREKERLEQYFQTVVKNLPDGVTVLRYERDGVMRPEFLSDGFAAMIGMTLEEAQRQHRTDIMAGVHPEDREAVRRQILNYIEGRENRCEMVYRLKKGKQTYIWVKNTLSLIENEGGERRVYAVYHDITKEREEQEEMRRKFKDLIVQHYRTPGPGALIVGHCNVTKGIILDVFDYTDSHLLETFGRDRELFFTGISQFVTDPEERRMFLNMYLNRPAQEAYRRGDLERRLHCFIKLPQESLGRYVEVKMNLVATPDSGDVTGILTITDITEQTVADRILHRLCANGYDLVADVDLVRDTYALLTYHADADRVISERGRHSDRVAWIRSRIVPGDQKRYEEALNPEYIKERLSSSGPYTFSFSITDDKGDIRTKNMTVSDIDLRLGRVCLSRTDITESVREQQGLLYMIAYTFELAGFIDLASRRLTIYSRKTVLENLPPEDIENYDGAIVRFVEKYGAQEDRENTYDQFRTETMLKRLGEDPNGYDFLFSYFNGNEKRYKQVNVLWGDVNHRTICLVRADVTDVLAAERRTKEKLESALSLAREASKAKSEFLSSMSHDIRTPMNAIMGMTTLAEAYIGDPDRVRDCLQKISISSRHLLSLVNDVLDMSKIEQSGITLNCVRVSLADFIKQLSDILAPQAKAAGICFQIETGEILHEYFYADILRMNQILINILGNAVKFTKPGGTVRFQVEEVSWKSERVGFCFTVSDTGIGMSEEFQKHLFEPFIRSEESVRNRIEGTGLGLSIVKGLVERMGGKISVKSSAGKGTVFRVELEFEGADSTEKDDFSAYVSLRVLLAGHGEESKRISRQLGGMGISCRAVSGREETLRLLKSEPPNSLLLLDADTEDGDALIRRGLEQSLKVLVMADEVESIEALEERLGQKIPYMNKPFFLSAFRRALEKIYRKKDSEKSPNQKKLLSGRRFLVAEDNLMNAEILRELMALYGAQTVTKSDGALAVKAFLDSPEGTYDAILMDSQMPNMDGYQAARTIRAMDRPDAGTIPIIAMTANAFDEDVQNALRAGMNAHVAKPINMDFLYTTLSGLFVTEP